MQVIVNVINMQPGMFDMYLPKSLYAHHWQPHNTSSIMQLTSTSASAQSGTSQDTMINQVIYAAGSNSQLAGLLSHQLEDISTSEVMGMSNSQVAGLSNS